MDTIITLATVPAILAIVQLGKDVGWLVGKWAALASLVLGVVFKVADYGFTTAPELVTPQGWYGAVTAGVLLGLAAAGTYESAKVVGVSVAKANRASAEKNVRVVGSVVPEPPAKE